MVLYQQEYKQGLQGRYGKVGQWVRILAVTGKPMTVDKLKKILNMLKYYDISDSLCMQHITDKIQSDFCKWRLQENEKHRRNVLTLFDYADNDFDRNLLRLRYVENKDYYDIAYETGYCDRQIFKCFQHALERLAKNVENIPCFEY